MRFRLAIESLVLVQIPQKGERAQRLRVVLPELRRPNLEGSLEVRPCHLVQPERVIRRPQSVLEPRGGERLRFEAALPPDLAELIEHYRARGTRAR